MSLAEVDRAAPVSDQAEAAEEWECDFSDMYRPAVGYSGCTCFHLPKWDKIPLPKNVDATDANFVARMARSRRPILSCDK